MDVTSLYTCIYLRYTYTYTCTTYICIQTVEYKENFDPRKVWLYDIVDDYYNPFTMDSAKQRVVVIKKPHQFPTSVWKKGPHYDKKEGTDTWFMTKESFEADSLKWFEVNLCASCINIYCIYIICIILLCMYIIPVYYWYYHYLYTGIVLYAHDFAEQRICRMFHTIICKKQCNTC